ncbi:MAG TPA: ATP-binding protein [Candidatus Saccharimonadales bacterium]|nr:ATP-binding protein [Candidatus Saccharimonadales bacterium]
MTKTQDLLQSKLASYLKSAWYARWGIVAIVALSFSFIPETERAVIESLLVLAVGYNLLLLWGAKHKVAILNNRSLILLIDGLMAMLLVIYTGGNNSPYLLTLAFMVISGGYWYGIGVSVGIGIVQLLILWGQYEIVQQSPGFPRTLILKVLIMISIGVYVSMLTSSDRLERQALIDLESETEKERQRLLTLVDSMRDGVLVIDNNNRIAIFNQSAAQLAGKNKQLKGQLMEDSFLFADSKHNTIKLNITADTTAEERKDLSLQVADKSFMDVSVNVAPYVVDRQNRGHVVIIRDVSQDKTIDKEREEFVAVASHELRTPLTIAQGDLSLLLSPAYLPKDPEAVDMLNGALRSLKQLGTIIKDLTNLSEVESNKLVLDLESLNPSDLVHEFAADYEDQSKSKGLALKVNVEPSLQTATILTSTHVVRQILTIYLTNALKFTENGSITIAVMKPNDGAPGITFAIRDTGLGVSQSDKKKIFEKFFQSEQYSTRVHGGTGLGLYIAKHLAIRISARLWFDSELGKGSSFYLWVPPYQQVKPVKVNKSNAIAKTKSKALPGVA